jgi:hypothetical protein
MVRKFAWSLILLATGLIVGSQRQDITRYFKVKRMSAGQGHPEYVPASGTHAYPKPGQGAGDGTGDFDTAHRGGPARTL